MNALLQRRTRLTLYIKWPCSFHFEQITANVPNFKHKNTYLTFLQQILYMEEKSMQIYEILNFNGKTPHFDSTYMINLFKIELLVYLRAIMILISIFKYFL